MCQTSIENESLWLSVDSPTTTTKIDLLPKQQQQLDKATADTTATATTTQTRDDRESGNKVTTTTTTDRHHDHDTTSNNDAEQEERVRAIRETMRGLLTKHLVQTTRATTNHHRPTNSSSSKVMTMMKKKYQQDAAVLKQQEALAKRLDVLLFEKASSLQEYANVQTLEGRVKSLLTHMLGRCLERAANREETSRELTLCRVLGGKEGVRKVVALVQDIKRLQWGAPNSSSKKKQHRRTPSTTSSTSSMSSVSSTPSTFSRTSSRSSSSSSYTSTSKMDKAVQDLFLNTPIVQVLELTPTDSLHKVPWEELTRQGQQVVTNYKEWLYAQQQPSPNNSVASSSSNHNSKMLTQSNIRALEQDLQATAADILGTFEQEMATAMQ